VQPGYGEGVYIGSAVSNWPCYGNTDGADRGHRVQVVGNHLGPNIAAELIDVKEGTTGGLISGNTFDGADGYRTHNVSTTPSFPSGCGNVWRNNVSDLGGVGQYAINVTSVPKCAGTPNVVYASNTVTNAVKGLTTIAVTP
jgi:hypothetical protein